MLAITSLIMLLIFSIGSQSTRTGFRLGRRALGVADAQVGEDTARALLQGLQPPAPGPKPPADLDGTPTTLTASASLARSTPCGGPGPVGVVRLSILRNDGKSMLTCQSQSASANLLDLGKVQAVFFYSLDGITWTDTVHITGQTVPGAAPKPTDSQERRLLVRLATSDGHYQLAEMLSSGPPAARQASAQ